jgi:hypothetical protein
MREWHKNNRATSRLASSEWKKRNPEMVLWKSAKYRARDKELAFEIEVSDILIPDVCPILGVEFQPGTLNAPTLDRKIPSQGYTKDNIWVISKRANMMKCDASQEQLLKFSQWVLREQSIPS